jgi:hypothetical protein
MWRENSESLGKKKGIELGCWGLDARYWMLDAGGWGWILDAGYSMLGAGF